MKVFITKQPVRTSVYRLIACQKTAVYIRRYGFKVKVFDWKRLGNLTESKMYSRELAKITKSRGCNLFDLNKLTTTGVLYE